MDSNKLLTIGISTYDDYDGVFFTIQSLRMYHEFCNSDSVEYIVLDNNPNSPSGAATKKFVEGTLAKLGKYISKEDKCSSFNKYEIVNYASGQYILILDCHVLLKRGAVHSLLEYYKDHPECKDLIQGPLLYDDLVNVATHFDTNWRGKMYGTWAKNKEKYELGQPFEIPMQGMGLCSFEKKYWPGISSHFVGFGGEEGYIAEKFRRNGGKNICIPQLQWNHRFARPNGVKYPLKLEDRIWNYFVGWLEITKDPEDSMIKSIYEYFVNEIDKDKLDTIFTKAKNLILSNN